jgi:exonuclease SbcD
MTRLAIAADIHADDYYPRLDPATGMNARFVDILRTTAWVGAKARELECEALVVAGDYTESKTPARSPRVVRIAEALAAGPDRQIHVQGNHDSDWGGVSIVDDLARRAGWTGYTRPGFELVGDVAVCAIPYMSRKYARTVPELAEVPDAELYSALAEQYLTIARGLFVQAQSAGAKSAILAGHQQLAGAQFADNQSATFLNGVDLVVDARALAAIGYAAVVFGHVHRAQDVIDDGLDGPCPVMYAGSLEKIDFAEENEVKSFVVLDVEPGQSVAWTRIPTPARSFLTIRGDGSFEPDAVRDSVVRAVELDPDLDTADLKRALEAAGAFVVTETRRRALERPEAAGNAIADSATPEDALAAYFAGDPDAEALVARGREILEAVR